jgi:hypothetical protein
VRLSVIAVLSLFCALILTASLLAEELDERTKEEVFLTEGDSLDDWLSRFDEFHLLVDSINDRFNAILAITLFYYFTHLPLPIFDIMDFVADPPDQYYQPGLILIRSMLLVLMYALPFGTIAIICQQLQVKV